MDRRAISVCGIVQGVGFRPFVYDLATRLGLAGFIRNQTDGVLIEVEGEANSLDLFLSELTSRPPPLAQIDEVHCLSRSQRGDRSFRIEPSTAGSAGSIVVSPDVATCDDCVRELFDPHDRRYRYPFLSCSNCGPRLTIIRGAPYDRERTTMASFALCALCRAEYENPRDRRFHAQPIACPRCGPRLQFLDAQGQAVEAAEPLKLGVSLLKDRRIAALKGLGGYHLACMACDRHAVAELRRRKHRDEKPLAIMVRDLAGARAICDVSPAEADLLISQRRPIVLLRRRPEASIAPEVAPGNPCLGVMLPYTPLHHLLLHDFDGAPLVMTSGNFSDEPIAYEDDDAVRRLTGIADFFLGNDRRIALRCDDSVTRVIGAQELPVRRSRGYAPAPLALPMSLPWPILATGGQLKATFALGRDQRAFVSHHLGDLDNYHAFRQFEKDIDLYERLFEIEPRQIAHDLHPDYASTHYARERAGVKRPGFADPDCLVPVQHHHAHMASCMAEHGLTEPVIGVTFDGTGYGLDGTIWGGEFLVGEYRSFRRAAHLRPVAMPGGDQAIKEPWRMGIAHLRDAAISSRALSERIESPALRMIEQMLDRGFNTPMTSSAGRLFDAVAAMAGLRLRASYEGQAAMELEWRATEVHDDRAYPFALEEVSERGSPGTTLLVDTRTLVRAVADDVARGDSPGAIGRRFHNGLVEVVAAVCDWIRSATRLGAVVLSGGVFLNALLSSDVAARLRSDGFRVYRHRLVPPNDGGLALGQLAVAAGRAQAAVPDENT
jgi:hydrogenase maturation protein HypF